ncbi:MAG TPA: protein-disulfide reductase DsbD domain-containing protein [Flavisolibacter sp.]|jgi:thiol:disulfide interchange protein DsbD|nr:protein-disulfide reductase DsbD domain-containing protein [Flavisolibacter sp.]
MKRLFFTMVLMFSISAAFSQIQSPVSWSFTSKKISETNYEVQMTATMQAGWHLYSQTQPKDAIAQPTSFKFTNNPLLQLDGTIKETGKMEKFTDKELDVSANQYSNKVVFAQKVKLKGKAKSNVGGTVTYQTCDDKKCLPPKTVNFNIALN